MKYLGKAWRCLWCVPAVCAFLLIVLCHLIAHGSLKKTVVLMERMGA